MKTTLKNLFDCALSCELEALINTGTATESGIPEETAEKIKAKVYKMTALSAPAGVIGSAKTAEKAGNAEKAAIGKAKKPSYIIIGGYSVQWQKIFLRGWTSLSHASI